MKIIFMGTPSFSATILKKLNNKHDVLAVVTKEDKKRSRGKGLDFSEVKKTAVILGIDRIFQPNNMRDEIFLDDIRNLNPDVIVTAAYGKIVPKALLDIPKFMCVNAHASLLPKYRGASPIQAAILNGDRVTGITVIKMDEGMDTGNMLLKKEIEILDGETSAELFERLAVLGADALLETLDLIESGNVSEKIQDNSLATYTKMISKEEGHINFNDKALDIVNRVRAVDSYFYLNEEKIKLLRARVFKCEETFDDRTCGCVVIADKRGFVIKASDGLVAVEILQVPCKKPFDCTAYINGYRPAVGSILK